MSISERNCHDTRAAGLTRTVPGGATGAAAGAIGRNRHRGRDRQGRVGGRGLLDRSLGRNGVCRRQFGPASLSSQRSEDESEEDECQAGEDEADHPELLGVAERWYSRVKYQTRVQTSISIPDVT